MLHATLAYTKAGADAEPSDGGDDSEDERRMSD